MPAHAEICQDHLLLKNFQFLSEEAVEDAFEPLCQLFPMCGQKIPGITKFRVAALQWPCMQCFTTI